MLYELRVENLLLMERAELRLAPGLNVLTGETGAGKTLLAHALDLLLGGRARGGIVRTGATEAYVEGVFARPPGLEQPLEERIPEDADELVLARRVWPDGRTRAYICGRSATVGDLRELGSRLLAFYGQHEHRKLMVATAQLDVLDGYGGPAQLELRGRVGAAYEEARDLRHRVADLQELAGARDRELDLIAFELDEIEAAAPSEDEQEALSAERDRLRHLEGLQTAAAAGAEALASDDDERGGVAPALAHAVAQLEAVAGVDPELAPLLERLLAVRYEAEDLGSELRRYSLGLEGAPGRLEEVEERLALFARLERKHGGSIADVLGHAERCRERRDQLENADVALETGQGELAAAERELAELATELSGRRAEAAPALAAAVRERLAELAMPDAHFEVELLPRQDGCGPRGADTVELSIAPNPGMPAGPLREIASGGELSRVMLALLSVAHAAHEATAGDPAPATPLLVFDEIDAGIGGHTARAVGEHLRALADGRQILCITHLPQVAALASRHFTIAKDTSELPARTTVTALDGDGVVDELVRMLGAGEGDAAASQHARQLLKAA
jgi:DNA repair protein RecN (Recombination protein N)